MNKNVNVSATKRDEVLSELIQFLTVDLGKGELITMLAGIQVEIFNLIELIPMESRNSIVVENTSKLVFYIQQLSEQIKQLEEANL